VRDVGLVDRLVAASIPLVPTGLVRHFARPYIGGETLEQALAVVTALNDRDLAATLDVLGEDVGSTSAVEAAVASYVAAIDAVASRGLRSGVSVKPSALGSRLGWSACHDAVATVVAHAAGVGRFVRLDMEESPTVDGTLQLYRQLRSEGHVNVGIVLQARLWRTAADVRALAGLRPDVRLCKGIYLEPPAVAMQEREAIRHSFAGLLRMLLRAGCRVAVATHDEALIADALAAADELGLDAAGYELQMLLGVRPDLAETLRRAGYRVRIYVPYGRDVLPYSVRRLRENPAVAGHVARALARDLTGAGHRAVSDCRRHLLGRGR
jgi:proline dehydrogenase